MAVKIVLKSASEREVVFPDDEAVRFTAQGFPDGRLEVTQTRQGRSDPGVVVVTYAEHEIERVIDNGWPSDNEPMR